MQFSRPGLDWKEDLKPRNWRNTANQHPLGAGVLAGLVILLAVLYGYRAVFFRPGRVVKPSRFAYYIDEETGAETVEPATAVPPLPGAGGKLTRVRAVFLSSDGGQTRVAGYYEKYTPEAQAALEADPAAGGSFSSPMIDAGHWVRKPAPGSPWVGFQSDEGRRVRAVANPDPSKPLLPCYPDHP